MAIAMRGLRVKPSYEQLVGVASSDGLEQNNSLTEMRKYFEKVLFHHNLMGWV